MDWHQVQMNLEFCLRLFRMHGTLQVLRRNGRIQVVHINLTDPGYTDIKDHESTENAEKEAARNIQWAIGKHLQDFDMSQFEFKGGKVTRRGITRWDKLV